MKRSFSFVVLWTVLAVVLSAVSQTAQDQIEVRKTAGNTRITIDATNTSASFVNIVELADGRIRVFANNEIFFFTCPTSGPAAPMILLLGSAAEIQFSQQLKLRHAL